MKVFAGAILAASTALSVVGCGASMTSVGFSLTDAPLGGADIASVTIAVDEVAVHSNKRANDQDSGWTRIVLTTPASINLLDLQNGATQALGEVPIRGGTSIQQIRLGISRVQILESGSPTPIDAVFSGDDLKINARNFAVPLSGACSIVVDFDVRKSLVRTGPGAYRLKPVLRAVFGNEAGSISGALSGGTAGTVYAVFAYAAGSLAYSGVDDPAATGAAAAPAYNHAYSSAIVDADGRYRLAYLDEGSYNLWVADAADTSGVPIKIYPPIAVSPGEATDAPLSLP